MLNKLISGKYTVFNVLSSTGQSIVYQAFKDKDESLKPYVLKVIERRRQSPKAVMSLESEIRIMQQVSHPNIIKLCEVYYDTEYIILVIEYGMRGDLVKILDSKGIIDCKVALDIMKQIFEALAYLHSHSIAHRDVKLENIVIMDDGTPKLIDFGLAKNYEVSQNSFSFDPDIKFKRVLRTTFCGTIEYMAPELFNGSAFSDPFAPDVWAAGMCLYVMCLGYFPWIENETSFKDQITNFKIRIPANWPEILKRVVKMSLAIDPAERATAAEIVKEIDNYNNVLPLPEFPPKVIMSSPLVPNAKLSKVLPIRNRKIIVPSRINIRMNKLKLIETKIPDSILF